ncbi:MAG: hypothetical protein AB1486_33235 [Planctomycetota bacterium]
MASRWLREAALVAALHKRKILTLEELRQAGRCSTMTVWRHLKHHGYYTSFNFNARYYTLAETPRFDNDGLWFYREVGFSLHGTLNQTLAALVQASPAGMTANELSALLRVRVQNQLYSLYTGHEVARVPSGRAHLYLATDEEMRARQLRQRETLVESPRPAAGLGEGALTDSEIIAILVEFARSPRSSARQVSTLLSGRGLNISRDQVTAVIEKYELRKKGR